MDDKLKAGMDRYYDARAGEFEGTYSGINTAIPVPEIYRKEVELVGELLSSFGEGRFIDIGCGTGFWLNFYHNNPNRITLIDRSDESLEVCQKKIEMLEIEEKCSILHGNFLEKDFSADEFDSAFTGFVLSHLDQGEKTDFFTKLTRIVKPGGKLMFVDSAWSSTMQEHRRRESLQTRFLRDGRAFLLYKRYFNLDDFKTIFRNHGIDMTFHRMMEAYIVIQGVVQRTP